jgi:hypothetical protein
MMDAKDIKMKIIEAGHQAVEQLIKVADRLKNAAATKKLAIFDAFEILNRIESEREGIEMLERGISKTDTKQGFAERRSISGR